MASLELRNGVWHLRWRDKRGKLRSQSTKITTSPKNDVLAEKKRIAFEMDLLRGKNPVVSLKLGSLFDDLLRDYTVNHKKSLAVTTLRVEKHLRPWFGEMRADKLGADDWREYIAARQRQDAANATINLERAGLVRAMNLARQSGKLEHLPYIPRLKGTAPRSGFLSASQLEILCRHLPDYLRPFVRFGFYTGWRLGEIRQLQWRHIDFEAGEIRLDLGSTKNGEGRVFPMTAELRSLLEPMAPASTGVRVIVNSDSPATKKAGPKVTPFVFTRKSGKPIKYLYVSWRKAVKAIGMPWLIFHDLRRSAAIYMDQQGIPRRVIMELMGHRTGQMFDNYRRVTTADLDRAREILDGSQSVRLSEKAKTENG